MVVEKNGTEAPTAFNGTVFEEESLASQEQYLALSLCLFVLILSFLFTSTKPEEGLASSVRTGREGGPVSTQKRRDSHVYAAQGGNQHAYHAYEHRTVDSKQEDRTMKKTLSGSEKDFVKRTTRVLALDALDGAIKLKENTPRQEERLDYVLANDMLNGKKPAGWKQGTEIEVLKPEDEASYMRRLSKHMNQQLDRLSVASDLGNEGQSVKHSSKTDLRYENGLCRPKNKCCLAETALLLLLGVVAGVVTYSLPHGTIMKGVIKLIEFDTNLFFVILLPPIIFNSGLEVYQKAFVNNLDGILVLAFLGTIISTVIITLLLYLCGQAGWIYPTTKLEAAAFGSLISATDPVTVLSVFESLKVKPDLLALVFGESVLNDVVAIVLYDTIVAHEMPTGEDVNLNDIEERSMIMSVLHGLSQFVTIFVGSVAIGILVGCFAALVFKADRPGTVEKCLVIIIPYLSYTLAQGLQLSGIVSLLFCGMMISRYAQLNLSSSSRTLLFDVYKAFATISESFVFIYIGLAFVLNLNSSFVPSFERVHSDPTTNLSGELLFCLVALAASLVARYFAIYPFCWMVNFFRRRKTSRWGRKRALKGMRTSVKTITRNETFILWYSGLRGGMAYALSTKSKNDLSNKRTADVFELATLVIIFFTVVICGSSMEYLVQLLHLSDSAVRKQQEGRDDRQQLLSERLQGTSDEILETLSLSTNDSCEAFENMNFPGNAVQATALTPPVSEHGCTQRFHELDTNIFMPLLLKKQVLNRLNSYKLDHELNTAKGSDGGRKNHFEVTQKNTTKNVNIEMTELALQ